MVATAIIGAGLIGAGASIVGTNKAAKAQTSAASKATAQQQKMFDITRGGLEPFRAAGAEELPLLKSLLNPETAGPALERTPGYQFALTQGMRGVTNGLSARGLAGPGGALVRGGTAFASGLASQTYNTLVQQALAAAGLGSSAAGAVGSAATTTGQGIASNTIGAGNAQAGAAIAGANAIGGLGNSLVASIYGPQLLDSYKTPASRGVFDLNAVNSALY